MSGLNTEILLTILGTYETREALHSRILNRANLCIQPINKEVGRYSKYNNNSNNNKNETHTEENVKKEEKNQNAFKIKDRKKCGNQKWSLIIKMYQ